MAIIKCHECGEAVSEYAAACPDCGFPIARKVERRRPRGVFLAMAVAGACIWIFLAATSDRVADQDVVALGKAELRKQAKDPDSVQFGEVWEGRTTRGTPIACGTFNAKNSFGAYTGEKRFTAAADIVMIEGGAVFDEWWQQSCRR